MCGGSLWHGVGAKLIVFDGMEPDVSVRACYIM